ncbi:MAG: isoaspartyl peptidase/L-asparaginase family protein [Candidatus Longimicrobiales bacterium M2_2A_002]
MIRARPIAAALAFIAAACTAPPADEADSGAADAPDAQPEAVLEWGLVMHGGAGTILPEDMSDSLEAEYRAKMTEAMLAGHGVLSAGGSSLDAVVAAITILEDSPLFNAGKGAVFTAEGTNSLDASIMDGATGNAGAVAGVTTVKNPIELARLVMDSSFHVLLAGEGAEAFGRLHGVEMVEPEYFYTERRWRQLEAAREEEAVGSADGAEGRSAPSSRAIRADTPGKFGTVGVVALDRSGHLAAGTSTGGTTNKKWGRIGDSPIIGAGTFAGARCGVSSTGTGEYFIRNVVAYDICARMRYTGYTLAQSAHAMIMEQLEAQAPELGGVIALDAGGHVVTMFNTAGMYRGWIGADGEAVTAIYR